MHLSFTLSTIPLILLSAGLCIKAKGRWLPVLMFMAVFQAASFAVIGVGGAELGLGCAYILLALAALQAVQTPPPSFAASNKRLRRAVLCLALFTAYASVATFVNPFLFKGVPITNPKYGFQIPLEWNPAYLSQLIYLWGSIILFLLAVYRTSLVELMKSLDWYIGGAVLGAALACYQLVCLKTGLPFPTEVLHTGPYTIFEAYEINGFPRVASTFTEAAAAAFYFAPALALLIWRVLSGAVSLRNICMATVLFTGMMLTISTTGYICLAFVAVVSIAKFSFSSRGSSNFRLVKILLAAPVVLLMLVVLANTSLREAAASLVQTVILDKSHSASFSERSQMNEDAISTAEQTFWLGAGWGMCRASSFVSTTLGNVGVPGFLLFTLAAMQMLAPLPGKRKRLNSIHGAIVFSLSCVFLNLIISAPEITAPIIWLLFAAALRFRQGAPPRSPQNLDQIWLGQSSMELVDQLGSQGYHAGLSNY